VVLIMVMLFASGLVRSLFFTSANALTFAEIDDENAAPATAITSAMQQVAIAVGVALAGGILDIVSTLNGGVLTVSAFHLAFFVIAAITALAIVPFLALPPNAGQAVSGHEIERAGPRAASPVRQ
jgi:MFS family permease